MGPAGAYSDEDKDMVGIARRVLAGICLLILIPLLITRGGLGEFARGASLTTAHVGTCFEDIDRMEIGHITCSARWSADSRQVEGTVTEVDSPDARAVSPSVNGVHFEVRLPVQDITVFADGTSARQADSKSMSLGAGFLIALVSLLAWEAVTLARRAAARRSLARLGSREATV